jgi:hypothetical protein
MYVSGVHLKNYWITNKQKYFCFVICFIKPTEEIDKNRFSY